MQYIYFDLESTGLDPYNDRIVQIGAEKSRKDMFEILIDPGVVMSKGAENVTGLSTESIQKYGTGSKKALRSFVEWLEEKKQPYVLIAYNGNSFDFPLFISELKRNSFVMKNDLSNLKGFIDPLCWVRNKWERRFCTRSLSLDSVYKLIFKNGFENAHNALADTHALCRICETEEFLGLFEDEASFLDKYAGCKKWIYLFHLRRKDKNILK